MQGPIGAFQQRMMIRERTAKAARINDPTSLRYIRRMTPREEAQRAVGQRLLELVPEYWAIHDQHKNESTAAFGDHLFLYDFANTLSAALTTEPRSPFVDHAMSFVNELGESSSQEQLNLLNVGILEILYTNGPEVRTKARELLSTKNRERFDAFSKYYR